MKRQPFLRSVLVLAVMAATACGGAGAPANLKEVQRVRSGDTDVVLLSANDAIRQGPDAFTIEFRTASGGQLVDVGDVKGSATMPMPGMGPMVGELDIRRTDEAGRYSAASNLSMTGDWRIAIEWTGAGGGSAAWTTAAQ